MVNKWSTNSQQMVSKWSTNSQKMVSKWSTNGQQMVSKWSANGQQMVNEWSGFQHKLTLVWCTNSELTIILCSLHGCLLWSLCWDMWTLLLQGGSRFVLFSDQLVWGFIKWNLVPRSKFATRGFQMARRRKISWLCNKLHPSVQCMCLFSTLYFSGICCAMLSKYIDSIWIHVIQWIKKSLGNYIQYRFKT